MFILRKLKGPRPGTVFATNAEELEWYAQFADIVIRSQLNTVWYQEQLSKSGELTDKNPITLDCIANIAYAALHSETESIRLRMQTEFVRLKECAFKYLDVFEERIDLLRKLDKLGEK